MEDYIPPMSDFENMQETIKISDFLDIDKAKCCFCDNYKGALIRLHQGWCCTNCFKKHILNI